MKSVLFAVKNMNIGGVEKSLLSLLSTMDPTEYDVDLLLLENYGGFMDEIPDWVNVIICEEYAGIKNEVNAAPIQAVRTNLRSGRLIRGVRLLKGYIKSQIKRNVSYYYREVFSGLKIQPKHYDVAISYTSLIGYLTWYVNHYIDADQYIGWIHFDIKNLIMDSKYIVESHKKMDKIYVVSMEAMNSFVTAFPELHEKCELKYNIVDQQQILKQSEELVEIIGEEDALTIVTLGRLTYEKGQDIVPLVAAELKNAGIRFKWYLIGDGGLRKSIEERIHELHLESEVLLLGTKMNPYPYLKQADIYVQTSIHEGYCITLAEAKVFGMPIISTEFAGSHEQLDELENSIVVERTSNNIAQAILEIEKQIAKEG